MSLAEQAATRPYTYKDEPTVLFLLRNGLAEQAIFASQVTPPEDENYVHRELKLHKLSLKNDPENWIVATEGEGVVGALRMRFLEDHHGPYASVRQLVTSSNHIGNQAERELIKAAIERAKASIATRLFINNLKSNPLLRLFEQMGFRELEMAHRIDRNPNHRLLWLPTRVGQASGPPWGFGPESKSWWIDSGKKPTSS